MLVFGVVFRRKKWKFAGKRFKMLSAVIKDYQLTKNVFTFEKCCHTISSEISETYLLNITNRFKTKKILFLYTRVGILIMPTL